MTLTAAMLALQIVAAASGLSEAMTGPTTAAMIVIPVGGALVAVIGCYLLGARAHVSEGGATLNRYAWAVRVPAVLAPLAVAAPILLAYFPLAGPSPVLVAGMRFGALTVVAAVAVPVWLGFAVVLRLGWIARLLATGETQHTASGLIVGLALFAAAPFLFLALEIAGVDGTGPACCFTPIAAVGLLAWVVGLLSLADAVRGGLRMVRRAVEDQSRSVQAGS